MAMKVVSLVVAGLAVAVLPTAPANAEHKCSVSNYPAISTGPCTKPKATSYAECQSMVRKNGANPSDAWWWCSNQGFKS
jgi:hypothetical protein